MSLFGVEVQSIRRQDDSDNDWLPVDDHDGIASSDDRSLDRGVPAALNSYDSEAHGAPFLVNPFLGCGWWLPALRVPLDVILVAGKPLL